MTQRAGMQRAGTILRRKVSAIRARGYSFPIQSELAAKLEYATAKGASSALRVPAEAIVEQTRVDRLGTLIGVLPMQGLFILLEFEGGGTAVIGFDMALVDHVVEILAGGDPGASRSLPARNPTTIDAALCRQVIGAIMTHFDEEMRALTNGVGLPRFRWGRVEHLPVALQYALPDCQYLIFRVNLDIGDDARGGGFHLAIPLSATEPVETVLRRSGFIRSQGESENWTRHMRSVVNRTRVQVTAVIDRERMQIAELLRLQVGGLFPLTDVTLDYVVLEMETGGETRAVARGRLGAYKRSKAIKLIEPPDPALLEPLAEALAARMATESLPADEMEGDVAEARDSVALVAGSRA